MICVSDTHCQQKLLIKVHYTAASCLAKSSRVMVRTVVVMMYLDLNLKVFSTHGPNIPKCKQDVPEVRGASCEEIYACSVSIKAAIPLPVPRSSGIVTSNNDLTFRVILWRTLQILWVQWKTQFKKLYYNTIWKGHALGYAHRSTCNVKDVSLMILQAHFYPSNTRVDWNRLCCYKGSQ